MRCAVRACTAHTLAAILRYVAIGCTGPCFVDVHVMGPKEAAIQVSGPWARLPWQTGGARVTEGGLELGAALSWAA